MLWVWLCCVYLIDFIMKKDIKNPFYSSNFLTMRTPKMQHFMVPLATHCIHFDDHGRNAQQFSQGFICNFF